MAGIRSLAQVIRNDAWFHETWHHIGMARAATLIEKAETVISPQEPGKEVSTTEIQNPYVYWSNRIREEIIVDLLAHADTYTSPLDKEFMLGIRGAAERIEDGKPK